MNRSLKIFTIVVIGITLTYPYQANALFGSECRDAKNSHKNVLNKHSEALKKWKAASADYQSRKTKKEQECLRNTEKAIRENSTTWRYAKPDKKVFCELVGFKVTSPIQAEHPDVSYKRAMEIIVNYKQCFKVEEFLDAKQWLREN